MNVRFLRSRAEQVVCLFLALTAAAFAQTNGTAIVRHAPTLNGAVEGSIQQLTAENCTLNGGASVAGDLLVPGTPTVRLNGHPNYGGTVDDIGSASPANYTVTLNGNAKLRHVIRRTDAVPLATVAAPAQPTGTRSVSLNKAGQSAGDFATIRNLTLNGNVGPVSVPPGVYGNFIANGGSGFVLGAVGATTPDVYGFQNLTLNGNSSFTVVGPVVVVIDGGFSTNGNMGAPSHPEWLALRIAGGGLSLNGNVSVYARVQAPAGTLTLNGNSRLVGALEADRLIVNGNSLLRLLEPTPNQPPTTALAISPEQTSFVAPASFTLTATASDADGAIAKVEFFQGSNKLGEDTIAPFSVSVSGLTTGAYSYTARATDDLGASADSPAVAITVTAPNQPPVISLAAPPDGALYTAPAAFSLSATASDPDGMIAKVEFFQDATKLGETFSAPFDFAVSALAPGTYAFTARAFDNAGATATSAASTITVVAPNQPPSVNLSAPADGSTYVAPATVTLVAAATDSDGTVVKVEFFEGSTKLGEALAAPFQLSVAQLGVGSHTFLARAYDNSGASVDSAPTTIEVTSPNQLPTVELTSPEDGAVFATPAATVTLTATAADADGTIAKVEFYQADVKLGEASNAPYTFVWNNVAPGSYAVTARAYDNAGAFTVSAARSVIVQVGLPYFTGFETGDGFALGGLAGQAGWAVTGDASVTESLSGAGQRSVLLTASQPAAQVAHRFPPYTGQTVVFLDLLAKPVASATPTPVLETDTARVGFLRSGTTGALQVFNADGAGGGAWEPTTATAGLLDNGQAANWIRLTLREDFAAKRWDLYANGQMVAHDLGFLDNAKSLFGQFSFTGGESAPSAFDEFYAGFDNPLFADADHDGMDDRWETAHGLNPAIDDRSADPDDDGLTNLQEYASGTDPADYYNGELPVITSLVDSSGQTGPNGLVAVRIARADGRTLANAPVSLAVGAGARIGVSATDTDAATSISVRTSADGIASGYVHFIDHAPTTLTATVSSGAATRSLEILLRPPNQPPQVAITSPRSTDQFTAPASIAIAAAATDDSSVTVVEFYADGTKIGEARQAPYNFTWAGVIAGAHTITATATDEVGASASSEPVTITVERAPNLPPTVVLVSPPDGGTYSAGAALLLRATASDSDGSVAKVEFYGGSEKLAEVGTTPYQFLWTPSHTGTFSLTAMACDDTGATAASEIHTISIVDPPPPLFATDFENSEGYQPGDLAGQNGWFNNGGGLAEISTTEHARGSQSVVLQPAEYPAEISCEIPWPPDGQTATYIDFYAKPAAATDFFSGSEFEMAGARFALVRSETDAHIQVFDPTPDWYSLVDTPAIIPLTPAGTAQDWVRFTICHHGRFWENGTWDLYVNGVSVATGIRRQSSYSLRVRVKGDTTAPVLLDAISIGARNPLYPDADGDGIDDQWEIAHGMDPTVDDREADLDGDGLGNMREITLGTNVASRDTDNDGLPDGWEVDHGYDPCRPDSTAVDEDGDGLSLADEIRLGTDPTKSDTDGDGLPDGWEVRYGLNPLLPGDDLDDLDDDTVLNIDEYKAGTNPDDRFDPADFIITPVYADGQLGPDGELAVRVTTAAGVPICRAKVIFDTQGGLERITSHPRSGISHKQMSTRTDGDGVARVYVRRPVE